MAHQTSDLEVRVVGEPCNEASFVLALTLAVTAFAETHRFEPKEFYKTFSGAHKPVLRIKPGDEVITMTLDAGGTDSAGVKRGQGPNPETGPFFIEGAGSPRSR